MGDRVQRLPETDGLKMSGNAQKIPFAASLSEYTRRRVQSEIESTGRALPASVVSQQAGRGVVTVKFEMTNTGLTLPNVTIPVFGPEWIRYPLIAGTKGVVVPFDASIGNMSGLGAKTSNLSRSANLSNLVFFPIGNSSFDDPGEANRLVLYGPDGAVLRSANKDYMVRVTETYAELANKDETFYVRVDATGAHVKGNLFVDGSINLNGTIQSFTGGAYGGNISTTGTIEGGTVKQGLIVLGTHKHTGVQTGGGTSGGPTP